MFNIASALPILTFHAVDDRSSVISFAPGLFSRTLSRLHQSGFRSVGLLEAAARLRNGDPLPERAYVVTFDDGYRSVYEEAFPVLQRYAITATVFLTVGKQRDEHPGQRLPSLDQRPMLAWNEIREMLRAGIHFGAHTLTHPDLTRLTLEPLEREIVESKKTIEDALGSSVESFAYPYGRYDARSRELVRRHFSCACSDRLGFAGPRSDVFALERIDAYYLRGVTGIAVMSNRWFPWYIKARALPRKLRRRMQKIGE
jgi:peptidoglycan/xylan/chitin deacetylase (PgdA/CDA1 family)